MKIPQNEIKELDEEWDIERTLELNAGLVAFAGSILALTVHKRWAIFTSSGHHVSRPAHRSGVVSPFAAVSCDGYKEPSRT